MRRENVMCDCGKVCSMYSMKNYFIYKCATTKMLLEDLKLKDTGLNLNWIENPEKPCDFRKTVKMYDITYTKVWRRLCDRLLASHVEILDAYVSGNKYDTFKHRLKALCDSVEKRGRFNPMTWSKVCEFDLYASKHLLIDPWQKSGKNKETWEEFLERFKSAEWVDKNYLIRERKYRDYFEKKKIDKENIIKSTEVLDIFPNLQKRIQKQLKKKYKTEEKIRLSKPCNIEELGFIKLKKELFKIEMEKEADLEDTEGLYDEIFAQDESEKEDASSQESEESEKDDFSIVEEALEEEDGEDEYGEQEGEDW